MSWRMDDLNRLIETIETAAKKEGLPTLSKRSGVPYTTLIDWQKTGWRPKAIVTLEKIAAAAARCPANDLDTLPQSEAA